VPRRFGRGDVILREGDEGSGAHVLLSGRAKVVTALPGGREVILGLTAPPTMVGDMAALDGGERTASVVAIEDVDTLYLPSASFRDAVARVPGFAAMLLTLAAARQRLADAQRREFAAYDITGRVARRVLELAEASSVPVDDGLELTVPLSQEELAEWTAASREAVNRALTTLRGLGWIAGRGRTIVVRDLDALRDYAQTVEA
jgi:CRP-like cAMP-binding protein